MISVTPESDYDCVYVELVDYASRVQIHLHVQAGTRDVAMRELRQLDVSSKAETVFALNNVNERLPCDPRGLGDSNVYSGYDYRGSSRGEFDEEKGDEEEASQLDDGGAGSLDFK